MSLRLEMLQVARLAPSILGEDATDLIRQFIWKHHNPDDGGFSDRDEKSDLYYTSFAIDALTALSEPLPEASLHRFLQNQLAEIGSLDFVHLCCLSRCASALKSEKITSAELSPVLAKIETYRTGDGGYNQAPALKTGSAYACFLACGAYADHQLALPDPDGIKNCIRSLKQENGAWANDTFMPVANVPATAAAVTLCRNLAIPITEDTPRWILEKCYHPVSGGLLAFPGAPLPDLLSTAVALHALDGLQVGFQDKKEKMLDFIDSLWSAEGGFHGSWEDDDLDIEYTYYGLLALGHLAM
jgi:prenyltransferase beta subunit